MLRCGHQSKRPNRRRTPPPSIPPQPSSQTSRRQSGNSSICSLAQEIVIIIVELLASRKYQLAFAKTCRAFLDAGYRVLYAHVQIGLQWSDSDLVLATLFHRPELAKYVRSYSGPLDLSPSSRSLFWRKMGELGCKTIPPEHAQENYFPIIFHHTTHIHEVKIIDYWSSDGGQHTWATICQMPLTKVVIHPGLEKMPLSKRLAAQSSILHLELDVLSLRSSQALRKAASYLPRIRHLRLRARYFQLYEVREDSLGSPSVGKNLLAHSHVCHRLQRQSVISHN